MTATGFNLNFLLYSVYSQCLRAMANAGHRSSSGLQRALKLPGYVHQTALLDGHSCRLAPQRCNNNSKHIHVITVYTDKRISHSTIITCCNCTIKPVNLFLTTYSLSLTFTDRSFKSGVCVGVIKVAPTFFGCTW